MHKSVRSSLALLASAALVGSGVGAAQARPPHDPPSHGQPAHGPSSHGPAGGAVTGRYPDVFAQAGYSERAVDARIRQAWKQLFHGAPGTLPDRSDGQSVYYELGDDMAYVEDIGNQDVRSEGMGYAMMIAVQLGHKSEFDKLWTFAKTKMQVTSGITKDFFAWHTDTTGKVIDPGIAPDGDQWIAAALVFASGRWGDGHGIRDYGAEATQILHAMWHQADDGGINMFDAATYLPTFSPPGAVGFTDPSYALPAFYKAFADFDRADATQWTKAAAAGEKLLQTAYDPSTGLTTCYTNFDGTPYWWPWEKQGDDTYSQTFQEDAWRAIANANVDAAWYGTKPWQTSYSNTLQAFFQKQGVSTYVSRYEKDGTPLPVGQNTYEPAHAEGLVAMNSTTALSATARGSKDFVRDLWATAIPSGKARYFDGLLYMLGLLYDSGTFQNWAPGAPHAHGHHGHGGR